MLISLQGSIFEIPDIVAVRSPYLSTLLNTLVGVEKDGNAYIIRDITLSQFEAYVHYLNTGYLDDNNEDLYTILEFMGHANIYELDIGRWYASLRDEWYMLYDESETGGLIELDINEFCIEGGNLTIPLFQGNSITTLDIARRYYFSGNNITKFFSEGIIRLYCNKDSVIHADREDVEKFIQDNSTDQPMNVEDITFAGRSSSLKSIIYNITSGHMQVVLDLSNNKLYMTHTSYYCHLYKSLYFTPYNITNVKEYIDNLCMYASLGYKLYLPMSRDITINVAKIDILIGRVFRNIKQLATRKNAVLYIEEENIGNSGPDYSSIVKFLIPKYREESDIVLNSLQLEEESEEYTTFKFYVCYKLIKEREKDNKVPIFVSLIRMSDEIRNHVFEINELNKLPIYENYADKLLMASAFGIDAVVEDTTVVDIQDIGSFYASSTLV